MQSGDKAVPHRYGTCLQILNILLLQLLKDACLKNAGARRPLEWLFMSKLLIGTCIEIWVLEDSDPQIFQLFSWRGRVHGVCTPQR